MEQSPDKDQGKKKVSEITTFPVPFALGEIKEKITITTKTTSKPSKEEIIKQAFKFHSQGNIPEALKCYQNCIKQGFKDYRIFSNYGVILKSLGKLQEAKLLQQKAIELQPNYAELNYNLGNTLKDLGNLKKAELLQRKAIALKPDYAEAYSNLGTILFNLGKLQDAELLHRKAIKLKFDYAIAHYNLGIVLSDLGKLQEAELSIRQAIELKPDLTRAYLSLSRLRYSNINNQIWQDKLFSESILNNKLETDQVDIYFARANVLHKEKKYKESAKYLKLGNQLKLSLKSLNTGKLIEKTNLLLNESNKKDINLKDNSTYPESIFIVGMPRSGSTLIESILSMNSNVNDLGEVTILEESFLKWKNNTKNLTLSEVYLKKISKQNSNFKVTTNKWLYNYQYAGIIASQMPNAKIIHCFRNPLDNILSIYRANFSRENEYSSSLIDCARVYLDQEEIMTKYKNRFRSKIYDLNYDSLVKNPNQEIKDLISWLGWKWDDKYLSPHLNPRSVSTASTVQVRSPINSKSIGGWKNYKDMMKPAIEVLTQNDRYRDFIS